MNPAPHSSLAKVARVRAHRGLAVLFLAVPLACTTLLGASGCNESDSPVTPLPPADLVAPPQDAAPEAAADGATAADGSADGAADASDAEAPVDATVPDGTALDGSQSAIEDAGVDASQDGAPASDSGDP